MLAVTKPKGKTKGKTKGKGKDARLGKLVESPEGEFVLGYLDDAAQRNEVIAGLLGALSHDDTADLIESLIEMCEDFAEALDYDDEDEDEDDDED